MSNQSIEPTRERIFQILRLQGPSTVADLADAMNITPIAVRHHLNSLQAEGSVDVREERHGVGRPRQVYRLTPQAMDRNPSRYYQFTNLLLEQLKEHLSPEMVDTLLRDVAASMADEWRDELAPLPLPQRVDRLAELLAQEGFVARADSSEAGKLRLTELSCPYARISLSHPEVCTLDASMISRALGIPVERTSCIRSGSDACTYSISEPEKEPCDD
jgi:DeoR family suf operon transcriptional repressor